MKAGQLRHWVQVESKSVSVDANGDRTETWSTFIECWASIATGNGREFFLAKQTIADLTHVLTMRFLPGITADMRVRFDDPKISNASRYFNIRALLNPDERSEMLELQCSEVVI